MCLLFVIKADTELTAAQVAAFWDKNKDGYGVMYAKDGFLHTSKAIGTKEQWTEFYMTHQAMNLPMAFHLRMRTHGDTDLENCHPYPVFNFDGMPKASHAVAMMHNGVLRTGNKKDETKSDTWHYVRDYIHKLTGGNQELIFTPEFGEVIGTHIGTNNKFCFVNSAGDVQVINRSSGMEWNGVWFSNTYAWNPHDYLLYPDAMPKTNWGGNYYYEGRYKAPAKVATQATLELDTEVAGVRKLAKNSSRRRSAITPITTPLTSSNVDKLIEKVDADYIEQCIAAVMLEKPAAAAYLGLIKRSDIYRMLNKWGVDAMYKLCEELLMDEIYPSSFSFVFHSEQTAENYFKWQKKWAGVEEPKVKKEPTPSINPLTISGDELDLMKRMEDAMARDDGFADNVSLSVTDSGLVVVAAQGE